MLNISYRTECEPAGTTKLEVVSLIIDTKTNVRAFNVIDSDTVNSDD